MLFSMLTPNGFILFSTEYHNSRQNIKILYAHIFSNSSEAWPNFFWEYINGKLFADQSTLAIIIINDTPI